MVRVVLRLRYNQIARKPGRCVNICSFNIRTTSVRVRSRKATHIYCGTQIIIISNHVSLRIAPDFDLIEWETFDENIMCQTHLRRKETHTILKNDIEFGNQAESKQNVAGFSHILAQTSLRTRNSRNGETCNEAAERRVSHVANLYKTESVDRSSADGAGDGRQPTNIKLAQTNGE